MRLLRTRFTLRSLTAGVVLSGVALGMAERSRRFDRLARDHAAQEAAADLKAKQAMVPIGQAMMQTPDGHRACHPIFADGAEGRRDRFVSNAAHHQVMARKYWAAARRPWMPLDPDPTEPTLPEVP